MAGAAEWIQAVGSVLAILAAAVAIFFQSRELREQKKVLAEQRRELTLQREQLGLQRQELAKNVAVQERIAETARHQHYLDLQVRLIVLMFDKPDLAVVFGLSDEPTEHQDWATHTYITAWMRLFQSGLATGHHGASTVEAELRETFFATQLGVNWWRNAEHFWRKEVAERPEDDIVAYVAFVELVERVCQYAEAQLGSKPSGEDQQDAGPEVTEDR